MPQPIETASETAFLAHHEGSEYSYAVDEDGHAHILRCITHERHVTVPGSLDGHAVTAVAHSAFAGLDSTESLILPSGRKGFDVKNSFIVTPFAPSFLSVGPPRIGQVKHTY